MKRFISWPALLTLFIAILFSSGCTLVHKQDMNQGNIMPNDKIAQLRPGLTMEQVHFLLGTPILDNYLHQNRWDYIYYFKTGYGKAERKYLVIYFKDEKVSNFSFSP